jgi:hypothetical protein
MAEYMAMQEADPDWKKYHPFFPPQLAEQPIMGAQEAR